ncbi:MAG TPA: primosomal protein N' [Patescibacteria group bacterium]|nr:primosomal protein N' [Patescibacteria group bacterium]
MSYVDVALARVHTGGKFFSYETDIKLPIGSVVIAPFGKKEAPGIIINIVKKPTFKTKKLVKVLPYRLPMNSLSLMKWLFEFYPDDPGLITQLFLPGNLTLKSHQKQANILQGQNQSLPKPTTDQQAAMGIINNPATKRVLLHGDTATGKTRVFIDKTKKILKTGKSVLILTPEIGLTPQLLNDLKKYVNSPIVLTHSDLTPAERRRVWEYALIDKNPAVFVGPRSALFLPIQNLGLVVIDESHDSSYKQSQSPRYQSLYVAGKLASIHSALLIQSTATPNVDDYEMAKAHGFKIIRMLQKAAGNSKSEMQIIDITDRQNFNKSPYLADSLIDAILNAINRQEQIMLFLNRRGSARSVQCDACGWQALCPNCGIPLIFHHDYYSIKCHLCSFKEPAPSACPVCASTNLVFKSIGTKTLVEHVQKLFPKARIMRFDADSTASEQYYRHINTLKSGAVDIIIGTQLISKGIDLTRLSVVGVVDADSGLNFPDFRAEEITFQQLYQVTGRTGRGHLTSKSFIQTRLPHHPVMQAIVNNSWQDFYTYEFNKRQQFIYPPFCYLAIFKIRKKTSHSAELASQKAYQILSSKNHLSLLGPSPGFYEKLGGLYGWQIIAKARKRSTLVNVAHNLDSEWVVDIDPTSLL